MSEHTIDAGDIVIVLIDLQEGIINVGATNDPQRFRACAGALADLAATFSLPVVFSCVPTTSGTVAPPLTEIAAHFPDLHVLVRSTADAFDDPPFRAELDALARKTVVIAGVATEVAVRLAAESALRTGFSPIVAIDACSGFDQRGETATFIALAARGIDLSSVATIAAQLAGDFTSERGRAAMRALQATLNVHGHSHDNADREQLP